VHPPLYFHGGGIKSMLAVMKQHVRLVKTVADPNTYVVMEDAGPLSPELALDKSDVALGGPPSHALTIDAPDECARVAQLFYVCLCIHVMPELVLDKSDVALGGPPSHAA
jgi:hypothetical protein